MEALFGQVHESMINMFGDEGTFEVDGENFYYGIEYPSGVAGLDEFVIYDGCGRSIPVDIESIDSLIEALEFIRDAHSTVREVMDTDNVISF